MTARRTRILIVDDSALMRKLLTQLLSAEPSFEVVGAASEPFAARDMIKELQPDVLTLDVEMPRMDGLTFLRNLMRLRPMPVVMVSSLTERSADVTLSALELGAFDFVTKPKLDLTQGLAACGSELIGKLKAAARSKPRIGAPRPIAPAAVRSLGAVRMTDQLLAIGASTGGTEAIAELLRALPADAPGVVIVQHIPPEFSRRFAERLDRECALSVREAKDDDEILVGHAYVAPGDHHLRVKRSGARWRCRLSDEPPVSGHRPSVDVLFESVASEAGRNAVGVLLTGMGVDGARGLGAMRAVGAVTIAQDRESSVVWGMPGEAVKRGAAVEVLPLGDIAERTLVLHRRSAA
jgi:two-component system, chemotaxis family, protein-glutamate methylesterase/glutaminase